MEYTGTFALEERLDASLGNGRSILLIGPGCIGKSGRIKAWAEEKQVNLYQLASHPGTGVVSPYQENTARGILVIDHPMNINYSELIEGLLTDKEKLVSDYYRETERKPEILFSVVVISDYPERNEENLRFINKIEAMEGWDIVRLDYDKRAQIPYFSESVKRMIPLEDEIENLGKEQYQKELLEIETQIKFFEFLLENDQFDTKAVDTDGVDCPGINNNDIKCFFDRMDQKEKTPGEKRLMEMFEQFHR